MTCAHCPHSAHLGVCPARNGGTANPCPCLHDAITAGAALGGGSDGPDVATLAALEALFCAGMAEKEKAPRERRRWKDRGAAAARVAI